MPCAWRIRYSGVDTDRANWSGGEVTGFHAGVVQHEYDHLDGILYPMRMTDFSLFGFSEELMRATAGESPRAGAGDDRHRRNAPTKRDAAIAALLPRVPEQGWTMAALRAAMGDIGADPLDAELLFPGGAADLIEAFDDLTDRRLEQPMGRRTWPPLRSPARVRALIAARLQANRPHKDAVRRALAVLALPGNLALAARCTGRTVDAIWHAAGDRSADFSWYTKRATLAAVYSATLLFWLRDDSDDDAATLAFLDRRLDGVARFGRLRRRAGDVIARCVPGMVPQAPREGSASGGKGAVAPLIP